MKKTILLIGLAVFTYCVHAQDTTQQPSATKQNNQKTMHHNRTMTADSVNGGKIRTNPNGKMVDTSSTIKRRKAYSKLVDEKFNGLYKIRFLLLIYTLWLSQY